MRRAITTLTVLSLVAALPALATPQAGEVFGDWAVECEPAPDGESHCFLSQSQLMTETKARLLKASIGYLGANQEAMLVLVLPLGVDLPAGAAVKVDDGPQIPLAYQQCVQDGCISVLALDDATLASLRQATRIQIGLMPFGSGQTMTAPLSPDGLARGMDALRQ